MPRRTVMPYSKETSSEYHNASFTNLIRKDSGPGPRKVTNGLNTTNWTKNHSLDETYQLLCLKRRMIQKMPLKTTYSGPDSISNLISIRKINMGQSLADKPWNKAKVGLLSTRTSMELKPRILEKNMVWWPNATAPQSMIQMGHHVPVVQSQKPRRKENGKLKKIRQMIKA